MELKRVRGSLHYGSRLPMVTLADGTTLDLAERYDTFQPDTLMVGLDREGDDVVPPFVGPVSFTLTMDVEASKSLFEHIREIAQRRAREHSEWLGAAFVGSFIGTIARHLWGRVRLAWERRKERLALERAERPTTF